MLKKKKSSSQKNNRKKHLLADLYIYSIRSIQIPNTIIVFIIITIHLDIMTEIKHTITKKSNYIKITEMEYFIDELLMRYFLL